MTDPENMTDEEMDAETRVICGKVTDMLAEMDADPVLSAMALFQLGALMGLVAGLTEEAIKEGMDLGRGAAIERFAVMKAKATNT